MHEDLLQPELHYRHSRLDHAKTPRMLESLAVEIDSGGVFSGFLEYTWLPGEEEIYQAHATRIRDAEECVRERMLNYAEELLLTFWPQLRGKNVRLEDLVSMGLPADQLDPFDFICHPNRPQLRGRPTAGGLRANTAYGFAHARFPEKK